MPASFVPLQGMGDPDVEQVHTLTRDRNTQKQQRTLFLCP
jgi:hypothetical protein